MRFMLEASELERPKKECRLRILRSSACSLRGALHDLSGEGEFQVPWGAGRSGSLDKVEPVRSHCVNPSLMLLVVGVIAEDNSSL